MIEFQLVTDADLRRFELMNRAKYVPSGCWEWQATKRRGYGLFSRERKTGGAHRYAYEAFNGPIPDGMVVRHTCDNPSCINPDHLVIGTMADNVADRVARDRGHKMRGEQIGTSKLTEIQVREIRTSPVGPKELGEKYGVAPSHICNIRSGKAWAHISTPDHSKEA